MTIIRPTTINARFSQPVGLGGEKLWLCPTLGGDRLDLSGNGNHGTYQGGMGTVADKSKGGVRAYSFDGNDDYVALPTSGVSSSQNLNSFSLWVNPDYISSTTVIFNAGTGINGNRFINLGITSTGNILCGRSNDWLIAGSHTTSSWYHLCVVSNGTSISSYKDGSLIGSRTDALVSYTETECRLGGFIRDTNYQYDGLLDDLRVFDRALTPTEIKHLASKRGVLGSPRQPYDPFKRTVVIVPAAIPAATVVGSIKKPKTIIKPSYQAGYARNASESENPKLWDGLVGAWMPSLGVTGETLRDVSGNGNHGTLTNMDAATDWVATSKGLALDFDGTNDYVRSIGSNITHEDFPRTHFTVSTWVKWAGGGGGSDGRNYVLQNTDVLGSHWPVSVEINSRDYNPPRFATWEHIGPTGGHLNTAKTVEQDRLYHFVVSRGLDNCMKIYVDGKEELSSPIQVSTLVAFKGFHIGTYRSANNRWFSGTISDVSIYNRALSPTEIKHLYVDSLAPFRKKQPVSVAVLAAVAPSATYHPLRSLAHPLEQ